MACGLCAAASVDSDDPDMSAWTLKMEICIQKLSPKKNDKIQEDVKGCEGIVEQLVD